MFQRAYRPACALPRLRAPEVTRGPPSFGNPSLFVCPRHWLSPCPRGSYAHGQRESLRAHGASSGCDGNPSTPHDLRERPEVDNWLVYLTCRSNNTRATLPSDSWPPLAAAEHGLTSRPGWPHNMHPRLPKVWSTFSNDLALLCHFEEKNPRGNFDDLHSRTYKVGLGSSILLLTEGVSATLCRGLMIIPKALPNYDCCP